MVSFTVEIGGVEYPFNKLRYKRSYKIDAQNAEVEIPIIDAGIANDDVLTIKRNGIAKFTGKIVVVKPDIDVKGGSMLTVEAYDYKRKTELLMATVKGYRSVQAHTQIQDQLADTDLSVGTFNGYGSLDSTSFGTSEQIKFDRRRVIEEICFITGWEFYAAPDGTCDFKLQCGTDRSATVKFNRSGGTIEEWDEPLSISIKHKVEKITVFGAGSIADMRYGIAVTGGYSAGDPEKTFDRKNLTTFVTCQKAAIALLVDFDNEIYHGVVKVVDTYDDSVGAENYDVFDTVNIVDTLIGLSGNYRIAEIEKIFSLTTGEQTYLTITNITKLNCSGQYLLKAGEQYIFDAYKGARSLSGLLQDQGKIAGLLRKWEGEDPDVVRGIYTTIETDTHASGGKALKKLSSSGTENMHYGADKKIGAGNFYALYCMKVADNSSDDDLITIDVYVYSGLPIEDRILASRTLKPSDFNESEKYQVFRLPFYAQENWADVSLRGMDCITGITDVWMDWIGVIPANVPPDTVIDDVDTLASVDPAPSQVVAAANNANVGDVDCDDSTWEPFGSIAVPDVAHDVLFLFVSIRMVEVGANSITVYVRAKQNSTYFPSSSGLVGHIVGTTAQHGVFMFTIPKNVQNETVYIELYHTIGSTKTFSGSIGCWGHSPHEHDHTEYSPLRGQTGAKGHDH